MPATEPISITDSALSRVEMILEGRRVLKPGHPLEDRGKIVSQSLYGLVRHFGCERTVA